MGKDFILQADSIGVSRLALRYDSLMRAALSYLLLSAGLCLAQDARGRPTITLTPTRLALTLAEIKNAGPSRAAVAQHLTDDILDLALPDRTPPRSIVLNFADALTAALAGKDLSRSDVGDLERAIYGVMSGSQATFSSASYVRQVLSRKRVDLATAQVVTKRFMAIGEELRGPDDVPLQRLLPRQR